ncbi:hypothetical protein RUND412_008219 [Rhizina undulata]
MGYEGLLDLSAELADAQKNLPLPEAFLKKVRTLLIKKPQSELEVSSKLSQIIATLFTTIIQSASTPTLLHSHRALACDALSTWLIRSSASPSLQAPLKSSGIKDECWDSMYSIVFANFDDAPSKLSKELKDLLGNVLSVYPREDLQDYMKKHANRILISMKVGAGKKVGYYVLEALIRKGLPAEWILARYKEIRPEEMGFEGNTDNKVVDGNGGLEGRKLVYDMLFSLKDRTLSPSIGKALIGLLSARREEFLATAGDEEGEKLWVQIWEVPLKAALSKDDIRGNVQIYVLPKLFAQRMACFRRFVEGLGLKRYSNIKGCEGEADGEELMSLLCCLKVGKDIGFVDEIGIIAFLSSMEHLVTVINNDIDDSPLSISSNALEPIRLPLALIKDLFAHAHPHIRLAALTLATYSVTFTKPLPRTAFELLKTALPPFHAETDAEVRNLVIGAIRGLIERLGSSSYVLEKEISSLIKKQKKFPTPTDADIIKGLKERLEDAKGFCVWYLKFLETQLQPGSNYQRVTTSLRILTLIINSGLDASLIPHLLPGGSTSSKREPGGSGKKGLLRWPAFSNEIQIFSPAMLRVLLDNIYNPFDDIRSMAADVLKFAPKMFDRENELKIFLERGIDEMNLSGRARDADGVGRCVELWFEFAEREKKVALPEEVWGVKVATADKELSVLRWVLDVLETEYITLAGTDFQKAVRDRPVHGLVSGLRFILERPGVYAAILQQGEAGNLERREWRKIIDRSLSICTQVWDITKGVLCFDSPEGHMPDGIGEEEDEDVNTQTVMSYSWRAVKETSSLLGVILSTAPYDANAPERSLLQDTDFSLGGSLLLSQLADIRHRGAFSAVSPSFVAVCSRCFRCGENTDVRKLPKEWLEQNLSLILSKSSAITRRSAGLPYLIIGILTAETDPVRPLLHQTFSEFVRIATISAHFNPGLKDKATESDKIDLPQVHALNCMKHLFTDSRLSSATSGLLLGKGLELAISCFASPIWAIRNCGIMLFTALLNRLFGTRKSRNDFVYTAESWSTRNFFEKYPAVRNVLIKSLKEKVVGLGEDDATSIELLYPALSLLARLDVSPDYPEMQEFEPPITTCLSSRIWKVREMAAKAYVTLVSAADCVPRIEDFLKTSTEKQNLLHGRLCAVRVLLERRARQAVAVASGGKKIEVMGKVWKALAEAFDRLVTGNRCAVTKAVFVRILTEHVLEEEGWPDDVHVESLRSAIEGYCNTAEELASEIKGSSIVGNTLLKEQLVRFMITKALLRPSSKPVKDILVLLKSDDEEIALNTATMLLEKTEDSPLPLDPEDAITLNNILWNIITTHPWDQPRALALRLLKKHIAAFPESLAGDNIIERWNTVMNILKKPRTEPLKDSSLAVLGGLTERVWMALQKVEGESIEGECLDKLVKEAAIAAHEDMPYPAREAALEALQALEPILNFRAISTWKLSPDSLINAYMRLYDLLNDDDEDIRETAAETVCRIIGSPFRLIPLTAACELAERLSSIYGSSGPFLQAAVWRITQKDGKGMDAREQLSETLKQNSILFVKEKQNLFIDGSLEANVWSSVIRKCIEAPGNNASKVAAVEELRLWVCDALAGIREAVEKKGRDGPLGWSGGEDMFVWGVGVLEVIEALGEKAVWSGVDEVHPLWVGRGQVRT